MSDFDPMDVVDREREKLARETDTENMRPAEYTGDEAPSYTPSWKKIQKKDWFQAEGPVRVSGWIGTKERFIGDTDGIPLLAFGKHEEEPAEEFPDYLRWMLEEDFSRETKVIAKRILWGIGKDVEWGEELVVALGESSDASADGEASSEVTGEELKELDKDELQTGSKAWRRKIEQENPRAYEPWTTEEERHMLGLFRTGHELAEVAEKLERQPGAIKARLGEIMERLGDGE